jgi:GNAT superfamily N-acetyltransferase
MTAGLVFRVANSSDVDSVVSLVNTAFEVERFFIDGDRVSRTDIEERLISGKFLLAEDGGLALGCVWIKRRGERAYVGLLSVNPSRQGTGLGTRLMRAAEEFARENGCRFMDLQIVNVRTELPGFYRRLGYLEIGIASFSAAVAPKLPCHFVKMSKPLAQASAQA